MNRVTFLVDGFNMYHSAREAQNDLQGLATRWLDLRSLLSDYLSVIGTDARLEEIYYFSALASHIDARHPGTTQRHKDYIDCLKSTGVRIRLGRFKKKNVWCGTCRVSHTHYEEKETDVALSLQVLELFHRDACDTVIFVSGDTDLSPAVRSADKLFPEKYVGFAFPYKRSNRELARLAYLSFKIRKEKYHSHQFSDPHRLGHGRLISKPQAWRMPSNLTLKLTSRDATRPSGNLARRYALLLK